MKGEFDSEESYYNCIERMRESIIEVVSLEEDKEVERLREEIKDLQTTVLDNKEKLEKAEESMRGLHLENEGMTKKYETVFENFVESEHELEEVKGKLKLLQDEQEAEGAKPKPSIARDSPIFRSKKDSGKVAEDSQDVVIRNVVSEEDQNIVEEMAQTIEGLMAEKEDMLQETVDLLEACKERYSTEKEEDRVRLKNDCLLFLKKGKSVWVSREREKCAMAVVARMKCQRAFMIWRVMGEKKRRVRLGEAFLKSVSDANEELGGVVELHSGKAALGRRGGSEGTGRRGGDGGTAGVKPGTAHNPFEKLTGL
jgi:hypothetical protein